MTIYVIFVSDPASMQSHLLYFVLFLGCLRLSVGIQEPTPQDVIVKPIKTGKQAVAVVLFTGPGIKPSQYSPLATTLQNMSSYSLWIGIPEFPSDAVLDSNIAQGIDRILMSLKSQGMEGSVKVFFAAHSPASAIVLQNYLVKNVTLTQSTSGQILMGSFLQRSYHTTPYQYPIKTLTISGELDGICRVTRIMEEYYLRIQQSKDFNEAITSFPVVIVRGMTHFQFASGEPSPQIKDNDFRPEISHDLAQATVTALVSNFIEVILGNTSQLSTIKTAVTNTGIFLQPIIEAYLLEASYKFKTPCYENPPSPSCQVGCPWTQTAMVTMGELPSAKLNDTDEIHPASELLPKFHHPAIFNKCSKPDSSCIVQLSSVSENIYNKDDSDDGLTPNSAKEIRAKLKSRQSVMIAAGFKNVDFNVSDAGSRCKTINQQAYNWALKMSGPSTVSRFKEFGVQLVMGEDRGCLDNGGLWIYLPMVYTQSKNSTGGDIVIIESIQMKTQVTYKIGIFAGMHYCKLLSPARAMEWIYVDGLRKYYSIG